jgi:hypothetical protein
MACNAAGPYRSGSEPTAARVADGSAAATGLPADGPGVGEHLYINLLFGAPRLPSQEGSKVAQGGSEGAKELSSTIGQGLPIEFYDELGVSEVLKKIDELSVSELTELRKYEKRHENRPTLVTHLGRKMSELNGERITKLLIARLTDK